MERITRPERKIIDYFQPYVMVYKVLCLVSTNLVQKYGLKEPNQHFGDLLRLRSQGALFDSLSTSDS